MMKNDWFIKVVPVSEMEKKTSKGETLKGDRGRSRILIIGYMLTGRIGTKYVEAKCSS